MTPLNMNCLNTGQMRIYKINSSMLFCLMLASCSNNLIIEEISSSFNQSSNQGNLINYAASIPYSSQLISLNRRNALSVLESQQNGIQIWITGDERRYKTYLNRFVATYDFDNDFEILFPPNLKNIFLKDISSWNSLIKFSNPVTDFLSKVILYPEQFPG